MSKTLLALSASFAAAATAVRWWFALAASSLAATMALSLKASMSVPSLEAPFMLMSRSLLVLLLGLEGCDWGTNGGAVVGSLDVGTIGADCCCGTTGAGGAGFGGTGTSFFCDECLDLLAAKNYTLCSRFSQLKSYLNFF